MSEDKRFDGKYFGVDNYGVPGGYESYDNDGFWKDTLKAINNYIPDPTDKSYLDLGCAFGHLLKRVPFKKRVGADISRYSLLKAQEKVPQPKGLIQLDADEGLPFINDSFGCITALDVVEHTQNFGKTVGELARVLEMGGLLILGTPITDTPEARFWGKYLDHDRTHYSKPARKALFTYLERTGFEVKESRYYFPLPWVKLPLPRTNMEIVAVKTSKTPEELKEIHDGRFSYLQKNRSL